MTPFPRDADGADDAPDTLRDEILGRLIPQFIGAFHKARKAKAPAEKAIALAAVAKVRRHLSWALRQERASRHEVIGK
jgi:hypothetical protein